MRRSSGSRRPIRAMITVLAPMRPPRRLFPYFWGEQLEDVLNQLCEKARLPAPKKAPMPISAFPRCLNLRWTQRTGTVHRPLPLQEINLSSVVGSRPLLRTPILSLIRLWQKRCVRLRIFWKAHQMWKWRPMILLKNGSASISGLFLTATAILRSG